VDEPEQVAHETSQSAHVAPEMKVPAGHVDTQAEPMRNRPLPQVVQFVDEPVHVKQDAMQAAHWRLASS